MQDQKEKLRALFVAGGLWQRYYLSYLKDIEYEITIINPIETETTQIAHHHIKKDVKDIQGILDEMTFAPDIICSDQCEIAMPTICQLSEIFGVRSPTKESIKLFTDKTKMYHHALLQNIPTPRHKELPQFEEQPFAPPFIIKPINSTSSRGFFKCESKLAEEQFASSKAFGDVLAQEFVEGVEITLEGICQNYKHTTVATSRKTHFRPGIASSLKYPADIPAPLLAKIVSDNNRFVDTSGYEFGITHAEYLVNIEQNKYWFVEIAGRGGGCGISSHIIKAVSGNNVFDVYTKMLLGETSTIKTEHNQCILQFFEFLPNNNKINLKEMREKIEKNPNILLFKFNFLDHQYLKPAITDQDRHALVISTNDEAIEEARKILNEGGLRC